MQFTIIIKELVGDIEVTHADLTVDLKCHPEVAVNWAAANMLRIVDICTDNEDELETPLHAVTVSMVPEENSILCAEALVVLREMTFHEACQVVQTIIDGTPYVVKEGITAAEAMDVSDVFRDLGCKAAIS